MTLQFWRGKKKYFFIISYLMDVIAFAIAVILTATIMNASWNDPFSLRLHLFTLVMLIITYTNYNLYRDKRSLFDDNDAMHIIYASGITAFLLCAFLFLFDPRDVRLYLTVIITLALSAAITITGRMLLNTMISYARRKGLDVKKTIYYGEQDEELIQKLEDKRLGYQLIKVTDDLETLKRNLPRADVVFLNTSTMDEELLNLITKHSHVNWKIVSSLFNLVIDPVSFDEFKDYPLINITNDDATKTYLNVKRGMDIVLSGLSLIALSPFLIIIAIFIKTTSKGPVFFIQERLGKDLKPFMLYKFRSMRANADKEKKGLRKKNEVNGLFKMKDDPRITTIGKFLRRSCIDELPQLINIFKGDMSLVGPRPHLQQELKHFAGWRRARFNVKPGLTGLWQVNGRHELNFDKAVLYDIYYVKHLSFLMDIGIILKTIPAIIMTKGRF